MMFFYFRYFIFLVVERICLDICYLKYFFRYFLFYVRKEFLWFRVYGDERLYCVVIV